MAPAFSPLKILSNSCCPPASIFLKISSVLWALYSMSVFMFILVFSSRRWYFLEWRSSSISASEDIITCLSSLTHSLYCVVALECLIEPASQTWRQCFVDELFPDLYQRRLPEKERWLTLYLRPNMISWVIVNYEMSQFFALLRTQTAISKSSAGNSLGSFL